MLKVKWVQSILLIAIMTLASFPTLPPHIAQAQTNQNNRELLSWSQIWDWLRRNKVTLGSRGGICLIAPAVVGQTPLAQGSSTPTAVDTTPQIWSDRPLFLWQGRVQRIEVRPHNSQEVLWSQTLTAADQSAQYAGEVLQPGQVYDWVLFDQFSRPTRFTFQVMAAERRDRVAAELTALEASLKDKGATTEQIALQRANYFAEHQLWSDALQAAFLVKNPSPELNDLICQTPAQLCGSPASRNLTP